MNVRNIFGILLVIIITSCNELGSSDDLSKSTISNQDSKFDLPELETNDNPFVIDFPNHPKTGKKYKFLGSKDSVDYVLLVDRTDDSTIVFQTANNIGSTKLYRGTALFNKAIGTINEKSIVTGNIYRAYEFIEVLDSISYQIRIGIDSIGSGERMLVRLIKSNGDKITIDLNMAN